MENWITSAGTSTNYCDKCGRSLDGKGWIESLGMKICGICKWEKDNEKHILD